MLIKTNVQVKMAAWQYKEFWKGKSVLYVNGDDLDTGSVPAAGWFIAKDGILTRMKSPELTEHEGKQPRTFGFYEAFAEVDIPMDHPGTLFGRAVVILESRDLFPKRPEIGRKVRVLNADGHGRFSDRPFECYLLDEDAQLEFDKRRMDSFTRLTKGSLGAPPEDYLRLTVSLDSWVHYEKDIPYTSVNTLADVEALMNDQLTAVVRADYMRLDSYFSAGRHAASYSMISSIFTKYPSLCSQ